MPRSPGGSSSLLGRLSTRSSFFSPKDIKCNVQLLDDSDTISNEFKKNDTAQTILDYVCELRGIQERDYFGLRYQDHNKHRYWLDLSRSISHVAKQFKSDVLALRLRFRFYPSNPSHLRDPNTKYQLFVQLRRDLLHGRLYCPQTHSAELAALILQAELGDYDAVERPANYVSEYKLLLRQTQKTEERIAEYHKTFKGKTSEEAELAFLNKASLLDTYGFDPYTVKDPKDPTAAVYLGVSHKGILIYQASQKLHHIAWDKLAKVDYLGRELRITTKEDYESPSGGPISSNGFEASSSSPSKKKDSSHRELKYTCPSGHFAKHLWTHILSQQAFFNEDSSKRIKPKFSKPRIPLLTRGSTFRFPSRKVLKEIEETPLPDESSLFMSASLLHDANATLPAELLSDKDTLDASIITNRSGTIRRYELPHQEPRQPSPWLNGTANKETTLHKYTSLPGNLRLHKEPLASTNGNNVVAVNLDSPLDPVTTPVDSAQLAASPSSPISVASDVLPSSTSTDGRTYISTASFSAVSGIAPGKENMPEPIELNAEAAEKSTREVLGLTSHPQFLSNGKTNGKLSQNGHTASQMPVARSSRFTNAFFVSLLSLILLIFILIALFERREDSDWMDSWPLFSRLRHHYYEPARHYATNQYHKYFR